MIKYKDLMIAIHTLYHDDNPTVLMLYRTQPYGVSLYAPMRFTEIWCTQMLPRSHAHKHGPNN